MNMTARIPVPQARFRRFGALGPAYEILDVIAELPDGDHMLKIRILESGEVVEYRLSHANDDPVED